MIGFECMELLMDPGNGVLESLDAAGVECDRCAPDRADDDDRGDR